MWLNPVQPMGSTSCLRFFLTLISEDWEFMSGLEKLECLASLIHQRNSLDSIIAEIIGRPAAPGSIGEFVAAAIFGIELYASAIHKGSDGIFPAGPLEGKRVEIKYYAKRDILDMKTESKPDYYLVLAGPRGNSRSSRGTTLPWLIEAVYLFHTATLEQKLRKREVKIGTATSVRHEFWDEAEIYPKPTNRIFSVSIHQAKLLALFQVV